MFSPHILVQSTDQTLVHFGGGFQQGMYLYVDAPTTKVSLKKTSNAEAAAMACVQGNPLYTLAGAVYEIHKDSATGPVVETLTTDANGNASGTVNYNIGTTLYAVETKAPPGYKLNSNPIQLTVAARDNVFQAKDEPVFDPQELEITKTGTSGQYIQGAMHIRQRDPVKVIKQLRHTLKDLKGAKSRPKRRSSVPGTIYLQRRTAQPARYD